MLSLPLAAVSPLMKIVIVIWCISAVFLILLVLVQKGRGGGLGAAFGGTGNSVLGTKTGDFLTWVTIGTVILWLVLSVAAARWYRPVQSDLLSEQPIQTSSLPQAVIPADTNTPLPDSDTNLPTQ
ncbi:MAG: preprotein translocase subunit SecG [Anaerohalosphaeraceae bacterium]|nr:preprotein translocase subunit SecG [Anaerohalosphaeraceae bacterium]